MKKLIIGVVVLAVLGVGGYLGFTRFVQYRARADVDAAFATLRQQGAQARHGDVSFDLSGRVLTVSGIDITAPDGAGTLKVDKLVASGITSPSGGTIQAARIDVTGLAVTANGLVAPGASLTYTVPAARIDNYSGPDRILPDTPGNGVHPALRRALVHFAAVRADTVAIPQMTGRITPAPGTPATAVASQPVDVTYAGLTASGIGEGRIAEVTLDKMTFATKMVIGDITESSSGEINALRASGIDTAPIRMLTDAEPKSTSYQPVYAKIATGLYKVSQGSQSTVSVGAVAIERVGINPVDLSFQRLDALSALGQRTTPLGPDDTARLLTLTAEALNGIAIGQIALTDITVTVKTGIATLAALKIEGFSSGRIETLTMEGLVGAPADKKPQTLKRAALHGFSWDALLRLSAETAKNDNNPTLDTGFGLFKVISGFEVEGISAPHESGGAVTIDALALSWSDFAGALPTKVSFKATRVSGPITSEDGQPFSYLLAAGMDKATLSMQLDLAYDAAARTLTLAPAFTEVDQAFSVRVDARLDNVDRSAFEDPAGAFLALQDASPALVKVTLTNLGLAELMLKQQADAAKVEPEDLRAELMSGVRQAAKDASVITPDAQSIGEAVAAFVKSPGSLTVTLTPKMPISVMQLITSADPLDAVTAFSVTATATPKP